MALLDEQGRCTTHRHPVNDRGDESTEANRERCVSEVGIVPARGGPWVVAVDKSKPGMDTFPAGVQYLVLHWASLLAGARRAYFNDKERKNRVVQLTVREGVSECKYYNPKTPGFVLKFLVHMGNIVNMAVTGITVLQVWRSTADCEQGFQQMRTKYKWETGNLPKSKLDEKKFQS